MRFDELLQKHVGEFGRFQKIVTAVVCLEDFLIAWQILAPVFMAAAPSFTCKDELLSNWSPNCSQSMIENLTQPKIQDHNGDMITDQCRLMELNLSSYGDMWKSEVCSGETDPPQAIRTAQCKEYSYQGDLFNPSVTVDFDLVCDREFIANTVAGIYMSGRVVGVFFFGMVSDRFGRRRIILLCGLASMLASFLSAVSPHLIMFLVFRFLHALLASGKTTASFILNIEYVGSSKRAMVGFLCMLSWSLGFISLPGLAFLFRHTSWRVFQAAITLPETLFFVMFHMATAAFVYYGLSLNTRELGGDPYINFLILGVVEIPANILAVVSFTFWGRVRPYAISMMLAGLLLLCTLPLAPENHWAVLGFQMVGKLSISASFSMGWVYAVEVYPTCIRGLGLMVPAMAARLMAALASYVNLLDNYNHIYPLLILGSMSLASGMLTLLLPEVKGNPMPQTIMEAEEGSKKSVHITKDDKPDKRKTSVSTVENDYHNWT